MENLWSEFRSAPSAYLQSTRTSPQVLVANMTQVLVSEQEKREQVKLRILGVWQETCHALFKDTERLMDAIKTLKDLLAQQKLSALFHSQVLCTITTLLIEMEMYVPTHDKELGSFVCTLFDYIEKMKSESNRLLKSIACDCLREIEMIYPGILSSKVGHFYGMSVAEYSYIHQHYKALFATVLDHTVQKYLYEESQEKVSSPPPTDTLTDLLSYEDPLKLYKVPPRYKETATAILRKEIPSSKSTDMAKFNEVKRGVTFILDWSHLFTPSCLLSTSMRLISCVQSASFSPKILKRLFQHSPSFDMRLFQLTMLLKVKFGAEICSEVEEAQLRMRLLRLCSQTTLPEHHRTLVLEWMTSWPQRDSPSSGLALSGGEGEGEETEEGEGGGEEGKRGLESEMSDSLEVELKEKVLKPTIFESLEIFYCKCKALCKYETSRPLNSKPFGPATISDMVVHVLKLVQSGALGEPASVLYRILFTWYRMQETQHTPQEKEIEKLVLELVFQHPQLIPNTIDFISSVQSSHSSSSLPLTLTSQIVQFLSLASLKQLLGNFPLYLVFIKHALAHPRINPVVMLQLLVKVLSTSSLCSRGQWDIGNTLVEICTTTMRVHTAESVFKDLSNLLQLLSENYNDLDIRDRARFYHQLMLTVSADKLSAILTLASDSSNGSSLSDIVEARISNSVFPAAVPIRKLGDGSQFLTLQRVRGGVNGTWKGYGKTSTSDKISGDREAVMNTYLQSLEYHGDPNTTTTSYSWIHVHYKINLSQIPLGISNTIYALVLSVSSNKHYHPTPDVYIPCLSLDSNGSQTSTDESIVVTFTFRPKEPVPSKFEVSAVFNTEDGITYSATLSPITLSFTDLFLPLPTSLLEKASSGGVFDLLWNHIVSMQHFVSTDGCEGILSTVYLECGEAKNWSFLSSEVMKAFQVFSSSLTKEERRRSSSAEPFSLTEKEQDETEDIRRLAIFLPPQYHLLLKFQMKHTPMGTTASSVDIATDNWKILPLVNTYLHGLVKQ